MAKQEGKATATVARGRTIFADGKQYASGEIVELPEDEVRRLRSTGHLLDPGAKAASEGIGPQFEQQPRTVKPV